MRSQPLPVNQRLLATLALGMASFMNVLDMTIVNVSVPSAPVRSATMTVLPTTVIAKFVLGPR